MPQWQRRSGRPRYRPDRRWAKRLELPARGIPIWRAALAAGETIAKF